MSGKKREAAGERILVLNLGYEHRKKRVLKIIFFTDFTDTIKIRAVTTDNQFNFRI